MKSFQVALQELSFDPVLAPLLAGSSAAQVEELAATAATADPYREGQALARALEIAGGSKDLLAPHLSHRLWCAWRQARWTCGSARPLEVEAVDVDWLHETASHPTVLVAPMTLATPDALHAVSALAPPGRPVIFFGEHMDEAEAELLEKPNMVTGMAREAVPRINEVLEQRGAFCTYADFVYDGRGAQQVDLFGTRRPISSGFLDLAARDDTMLLPLVALRRDEAISVQFEEPLQISLADELAADRLAARQQLAPVVAHALETLIARAPEQWLLLPTLTFEAPEMSKRDAT
jgi:hypothetical protein